MDSRRAQADALLSELRKGPQQGTSTTMAYAEPLYGQLKSAHESGVLDVLHRLLDNEQEGALRRASKRSLTKRTAHGIIMDAFRTFQEIIADLHEARSLTAATNAIIGHGRAAYLGIVLVVCSLFAIVFIP